MPKKPQPEKWTLPKKLRILGHDVFVEEVNLPPMANSKDIGECDTDASEIRLGVWLEQSISRATLLHEVIHFIDHTLDLDMTEAQVTGVAQGLFQVLRDNEKFL